MLRAVGVVGRNWILDKYLKAEQSVESLISLQALVLELSCL